MQNYGVISMSDFKGSVYNTNWGSIFVKPFGTSIEIFVAEIFSWNILRCAQERRFVGI
jgi:hypothetical protein